MKYERMSRWVVYILAVGAIGVIQGCSNEARQVTIHLTPQGVPEGPLETARISRMGFAAPVGAWYHIPVDVPRGDCTLHVACTMLPQDHDTAGSSALFRAELRGARADTHLIFQRIVHSGTWTDNTIDLSPFRDFSGELYLYSRAVETGSNGFACWATPYMVVSGRPSTPNIILISIDALRADHLSCYGYDRRTSPTLDSLAARSWLCANAISQAPWTLPAHASIMTSQYLHSHGMTTWQKTLNPEEITLAELLRKAGYLTCGIIGGALPISRGLNQGFDRYDAGCFVRSSSHRTTNQCTHDRAIGWLRDYSHVPFFLFLHYWDVHDPYIPPAPYDTLFDPDYDGTVRGWETIYGWEALKQRMHEEERELSARDVEHIEALYDGEIAHTDRFLSMLFDELRDLGLDKNSLLIVTADHGDEFLEHGRTGHGKTLYDEVIHVPLIWSEPGGEGRSRGTVASPIQTMDIAPTVLEYLGLDIPAEMQGTSFLHLLAGSSSAPSSPIFSEVVGFTPVEGSTYAIIGDTIKVIYRSAEDSTAAYDLVRDPYERNPLPPSEIRGGPELRASLDSFVKTVRLHIAVTNSGAGVRYAIRVGGVLPVALRASQLEVTDSVRTERELGMVRFEGICADDDSDELILDIPLTRHAIDISAEADGVPWSGDLVWLGRGDHPRTVPFTIPDNDDARVRVEKDWRPPLDVRNENPALSVWIEADCLTAGSISRTERDAGVEAELRALGYIR